MQNKVLCDCVGNSEGHTKAVSRPEQESSTLCDCVGNSEGETKAVSRLTQ